MNCYYLAHPVSPTEKYSVEQNLAHIVVLTKLLWDKEVAAIASYYPQILAIPDSPKTRAYGLASDFEVIKGLHGHIILLGDRISSGMEAELGVARQWCLDDKHIVDLTGVPDADLGGEIDARPWMGW